MTKKLTVAAEPIRGTLVSVKIMSENLGLSEHEVKVALKSGMHKMREYLRVRNVEFLDIIPDEHEIKTDSFSFLVDD